MVDIIQIEKLKNEIIGCGIEVHRTLGPGLLERVCLLIELAKHRLHAEWNQVSDTKARRSAAF